MADFLEYQDFQNRPFHRAYLDGKLPCPHILCKSNCGKVFFEEQGIAQHFRIKHRGIVLDEEKQLRDARRMFRFSHGEETKRYLEILSNERLIEVGKMHCFRDPCAWQMNNS